VCVDTDECSDNDNCASAGDTLSTCRDIAAPGTGFVRFLRNVAGRISTCCLLIGVRLLRWIYRARLCLLCQRLRGPGGIYWICGREWTHNFWRIPCRFVRDRFHRLACIDFMPIQSFVDHHGRMHHCELRHSVTNKLRRRFRFLLHISIYSGHLFLILGASTYGSSRSVSCATGYSGTASSISCQESGAWSSSSGCTIVSCGTPPETTGYVIASGGSNYGSTRTVTCTAGSHRLHLGKILNVKIGS
jgi:hypothetical protein